MDAERSPCCQESVQCPYADKARLHDSVVQHVIAAFKASYEQGYRYDFGIENPDGELKFRPFMQQENWPPGLPWVYKPFDCCAFNTQSEKSNVILD